MAHGSENLEGPVNSVATKLEHLGLVGETAPIMVRGYLPFSRLSGSLDVNHWRLHCELAEGMAEAGTELVDRSDSGGVSVDCSISGSC